MRNRKLDDMVCLLWDHTISEPNVDLPTLRPCDLPSLTHGTEPV